MGEEQRIGIIYQNNENWIGGSYYIQNLVAALNTLPEEKKPLLTIFCKKEEEYDQIKITGYSRLMWKQLAIRQGTLSIYKRVINKIAKRLNGFDVYPQELKLDSGDCTVIFPAYPELKEKTVKKIFWIPDFQEQKLSHFFSKREIADRTQSHRFIAQSKGKVVFSSKDAFQTFEELFPNAAIEKNILHFAVTHPVAFQELDINVLKGKFNLDRPYFFAPNQFWKHKNQQVILNAIKILKEKGIVNFIVAFSGKEQDYRNPEYPNTLKRYVADNNLTEQVRFLGFIDRAEQLKLMSEAIAIIQPSLFEGWSTVVEDAKAMNQWVIASDLSVHREQLQDNVSFFKADDYSELANLLVFGINEGYKIEKKDYKKAIYTFASEFIKLIHE